MRAGQELPAQLVTVRALLAIAALSVSAACGGDSGKAGPVHCDGDPPSLELGTGTTSFVPLKDGDPVRIVCGDQGAQHINVRFRAKGTSGEYDAKVRLTDAASGTDIAAPSPSVGLSFVARDGFCQPDTPLRLGVAGTRSQWDAREVVLSLAVDDAAGHVLSDERHVKVDVSEFTCGAP